MKKWEQVIGWLKEAENRIVVAALFLGTVITVILAGCITVAEQEQEGLYDNLFRFHVLASSDSKEDQQLKIKVRDAVLDYLEPVLNSSQSKEETKAYIIEHLAEINDLAGRTLRLEGSSQKVHSVVGVSDFPTKSYGNVTLPAGRYESLCIKIGEAKGQNWWCVMFPTLCFVEETEPEEMEEKLEKTLPKEQNEMIHQPKKFKFILVEWYYRLFG